PAALLMGTAREMSIGLTTPASSHGMPTHDERDHERDGRGRSHPLHRSATCSPFAVLTLVAEGHTRSTGRAVARYVIPYQDERRLPARAGSLPHPRGRTDPRPEREALGRGVPT